MISPSALLVVCLLTGTSHAFSTVSNSRRSIKIDTVLYGAKRRGGGLANNVSLDDDGRVKGIISNKTKQKRSGKSKRDNKRSDKDVTISPLLAEWAAEDNDDNGSSSSSSSSAKGMSKSTNTDSYASNVFVPFDDEDSSSSTNGKKKNKKGKKSNSNKQARALLTEAQTAQVDELLESITSTLETTNCDVPSLVSSIKKLVDLPSTFTKDQILLPTLKSILSTRDVENQPSYRLAWVGSDNAICHIGTSLHKVPLARLQEIYLCLGFNRWEILEVIRILGPFPNVRNTLKGELKVKKLAAERREGVQLQIAYNSMIDGTGKEILAGKEDNVKNVPLNVWFASDRAVVCTVPSSDDEGGDVLGGNGENILFFVREENLDESLEKLRAA